MSKITIDRSALEQALEALVGSVAITMKKIDVRIVALATLREALEQPQQEPQTNTDGLLPIDARDHPENHVSLWTETELQAIRDYAARCVDAAISAHPQQESVVCWYRPPCEFEPDGEAVYGPQDPNMPGLDTGWLPAVAVQRPTIQRLPSDDTEGGCVG